MLLTIILFFSFPDSKFHLFAYEIKKSQRMRNHTDALLVNISLNNNNNK